MLDRGESREHPRAITYLDRTRAICIAGRRAAAWQSYLDEFPARHGRKRQLQPLRERLKLDKEPPLPPKSGV